MSVRAAIVVWFAWIALPGAHAEDAPQRTVATPAELAAVMKSAKPGDTLVLADGVWNDADLLFEGDGADGKPITLRAQTPGKVVLSGSSRLRIAGSHLVVDGLCFRDGYLEGQVIQFRRDSKKPSDHCRLTNTAVLDYNPPDPKADSRWVGLYGKQNRVDHCDFAGKTNVGTTLVVWVGDEPNEHRIDHNRFGPRPPLGENGGETIRIGTSDVSLRNSRTVVEHNLFQECSGEAEIISVKSCGNVLRYNTFVGCGGALTLRHGNRNTVEGNWFFGDGKKGTGGVRVIGEDHKVFNNYFHELTGDKARAALSIMNGLPDSPLSGYLQVKRAIVAFNTFVNCRQSILIGLGASEKQPLPPTDCMIACNLLVCDKHPLIQQDAEPVNLTWLLNVFHGPVLGIGTPANVLPVDPKMHLDGNGVWRPSPRSAVAWSAIDGFSFLKDDIDGQPRAELLSVGCDQLSDAPVTRKPLTPADVGPEWRR
jgi:poly(beta-D-mannuronate) lyase